MRPVLDLTAPIVPARGLGGLEIGGHVADYGELLNDADSNYKWHNAGEDWKYIFSLWEARYRLSQVYETTDDEFERMVESSDLWVPDTPPMGLPAVELAVDIRDGLVFALHALERYEGTLFGSLRVGMSGAESIEAEPRLRYEEADGGFVVQNEPGVCLLLGPDGYDLEPEQVRAATIDQIWVFDPNRADDGVLAQSPSEIEGA